MNLLNSNRSRAPALRGVQEEEEDQEQHVLLPPPPPPVLLLTEEPRNSNVLNPDYYDTTFLRVGIPISSCLLSSDRNQVSDFTNAVIDEMQVDFFSKADVDIQMFHCRAITTRTPIGFAGMSCRHCGGSNDRSGRYFPLSIKSMSDSKKSLYAMHKHLTKCEKCPQGIRFRLGNFSRAHTEEFRMNRNQGSQRRYFQKIWTSLHPNPS